MNKTPKLRFPEFSGEWEEKKLEELLEFKNGINASKEQYGHGVKFINVLDILTNDFITYDKIIGKVDIDEETLNKYPVTYGDILFQRSSETREEVGTANVYLDKGYTATFGGFVIRGKKIAEYNPIFLNKVLKTPLARNEITSKSGGSTRYNVGQETLSQIELFFASLPEQEEIASFLSSVDSKIEKLERKKELWEQYKKGMMQKIFSQELRFKDENGDDYPEWEEKKLREICQIIMGQSPSSSAYNENLDGLLLVQGNADCKNRKVFPRVYTSEITKTSESGDIIMSVRAPAGTVAISDIQSCIGRGVCAIRKKSEVHEFVFQYLINYEKEWSKYSQGSTFDSINSNDVKELIINIPSLPEQEEIASFLSSIDSKIEIVEKKLVGMKEFKKGLLQKMFV